MITIFRKTGLGAEISCLIDGDNTAIWQRGFVSIDPPIRVVSQAHVLQGRWIELEYAAFASTT